MDLTPQQRKKLLGKVERLVARKFFDANFNGHDWPALVKAREKQILEAGSPEEFEKEVHSLVSQLGVSHIGFGHESSRRVPSRRSICATFRNHESSNGPCWVFQDVHEDGPAFNAGLRPGDVLCTVNGREIRPPEDPEFPMGITMPVTIERRDGQRQSIELAVPKSKSKKFPYTEPRLVSWSKLEEGVGWLKVSMFPGQVGIDISHDIDEAVRQLEDCGRLIIDLRGNSGGGMGMLRLMSYLTPHKLPVGYSLTRRRALKGYRKEDLARFGWIPSRKIALIWLALRYGFVDKSIAVVTEGLGPKRFHGRIVILVNEHSASASEVIAAFAQEDKLARIVGTPTVGRLLSGDPHRVGHGYMLVVPTAAYLTWNGQFIEGKGIKPDHEVAWSLESVREGKDHQIERALDIVKQL